MGKNAEKKPLSTKAKAILAVLIMVIFIVSCMIVVYVYNDINKTEGTVEPEKTEAADVLEKPNSVSESVEMLNSLVKKAQDKNYAKSDVYTNARFSDIKFEGSEDEQKLIEFLSEKYLPSVSSKYENCSDRFGSDDVIFDFVFSEKDIAEVDNKIDESNEDIYKIELTYSEKAEFFGKEKDSDIFKDIKNEASSVFDIKKSDITLSFAKIIANVNLKTGSIERLEFSREYNVSLNTEFVGDYASVGNRELNFNYGVSTVYNLSYVNVYFPEKVKYIEKGESFGINVQSKIEDDGEFELNLKSSDESVLTIGEDGYAKGISESPEYVTITAVLKYLGREYTDSCKVYVLNPVKKVVCDTKEKAVNIGEEFKLNAVITPDDATINTVKWYSENENIATVDEIGNIKAVGKGEVKVYCVTDNGYFRASCVLTVN